MSASVATPSVSVMLLEKCWTTCLLLLAAAGCRSAEPVPVRGADENPQQRALRAQLDEFGHHFATRVERAADDIAAQTTDPKIRRNSVHLKMRMIPMCRRMVANPDSRVALVNTWLVCASVAYVLDHDVGEELFGEGRSTAVEAFRTLEIAIQALCEANLEPEEVERARERIKAFSAVALDAGGKAGLEKGDKRLESAIGTLVGKPVSFFQSSFERINPTGGLSDTAVAIHNASDSVDQARNVIEYLPEDIRWQTELLVYQLETTPVVLAAVDSMTRMSDASADVAQTAANLPATLRAELSAFVTEIDQRQSGLQATLQETRATIEELDGSLQRVETIVGSVEPTAEALTTMGDSFKGAIGELKATMEVLKGPESEKETEPVEEKEPSKPFDINDYARTAERLTETAQALSTVLEQLRGLATPEQTAPVLDAVDATTRQTVDHLTWRAVQLVGAILTAAVAYRLLSVRLVRRVVDG